MLTLFKMFLFLMSFSVFAQNHSDVNAKKIMDLDDHLLFLDDRGGRGGGDVSGGTGGDGSYHFKISDFFTPSDTKSLLLNQQKMMKVDKFHQQGSLGQGQTIMVIDSGLSNSFSKKKNIIEFKDFSGKCSMKSMCDGHSHGTYVTDLILQMAPEAKIVVARVLDDKGNGNLVSLVKALKWAKKKHKKLGINIINLSLINHTSLHGEYNEVDKVLALINELTSKGVHIVVNAGNDGSKVFENMISASDNAITVGSYSHYFSLDRNDYKLSRFSNTGVASLPQTSHSKIPLLFNNTTRDFNYTVLKPDVLAPGHYILGEVSQGSFLSQKAQLLEQMHKTGKIPGEIEKFITAEERMLLQGFRAGAEFVLLNNSERALTDKMAFMSGTTASAALMSGTIATFQSANKKNLKPEAMKSLLSNRQIGPSTLIRDRKMIGAVDLFTSP